MQNYEQIFKECGVVIPEDKKEEFYKSITVANARKKLFFHLLDKGYDLMSVMQMLAIDPSNLTNYIDNNFVKMNNRHVIGEIDKQGIHPMEGFINDIYKG